MEHPERSQSSVEEGTRAPEDMPPRDPAAPAQGGHEQQAQPPAQGGGDQQQAPAQGGHDQQQAPAPPGGHEQGQRGPEAEQTHAAGPTPGEGNVNAPRSESTPLLSSHDTERFELRWEEVKVSFVDEPRSAVQQADSLVAEVVTQLSEVFTNERRNLEGQWDRGEEVSTEDLRVALQRYRSFFNRLLSTRGG